MATNDTSPDARRRETGTSLNAKGSISPDSGAFAEVGSATPLARRELVPALGTWQNQVVTYDKMAYSDVSTDLSLRAAKIPILNGRFYLEPYDEEQENLDISEFIRFNIFEAPTQPFGTMLEDILRFMEYGFSTLEAVVENREWSPSRTGANRRKYTMLRKLAPRPSPTITNFLYDKNGGPVSIKQQAITDPEKGTTEEVEIPIEKLLIFSFNKRGGDLKGKSILRTAYEPWFYKQHLYKIDAIQKERHGIGVPDIELQPGFTDADRNYAHEMARNLRVNERAYIVRPPGMQVGFAKPEGELVDVLASAVHHDNQIMKNVLVQFINLGLEAGGGRATASSQVDIFTKSLRYTAGIVCDYFNLFLIPKLVGYNFDTDRFPKMKAVRLGEKRDMQLFAAAMSNLVAQNAITVDKETENWIREEMDMPLLKGERPAEVEVPQFPSEGGDVESNNGDGTENGSKKGDIDPNRIQTGNMGAPPNAAR